MQETRGAPFLRILALPASILSAPRLMACCLPSCMGGGACKVQAPNKQVAGVKEVVLRIRREVCLC